MTRIREEEEVLDGFLMILRSFWGFFMMLNPFMILSKQLQVVLTHFRWKILIFCVAERQTRDYYRFKKTPNVVPRFGGF